MGRNKRTTEYLNTRAAPRKGGPRDSYTCYADISDTLLLSVCCSDDVFLQYLFMCRSRIPSVCVRALCISAKLNVLTRFVCDMSFVCVYAKYTYFNIHVDAEYKYTYTHPCHTTRIKWYKIQYAIACNGSRRHRQGTSQWNETERRGRAGGEAQQQTTENKNEKNSNERIK